MHAILRLPVFLALAPAVFAAAPLSVEKSIRNRDISDLSFSPDGTSLVMVVKEPPSGEKSLSHLWLYRQGEKTVRPWTLSAKTEQAPHWSPDGKTLAFLSDREDGMQVWLMPHDGGEAARFTKGKNSVTTFKWSADGAKIAFLATDPKTPEQEQKEKNKDDARVVDVDTKPVRLWIAEVGTEKVTAITEAPWQVRDFDWMPDGQTLLVYATDRPWVELRTEKLYVLSVAGGPLKEVFSPGGPFSRMQISPDGKRVAFVGSPIDGPTPHDLQVIDTTHWKATNLTGPRLDRPIMAFDWRADGVIDVLYVDGFRSKLGTVGSSFDARAATPGGNPAAFAVSKSGALATVSETAGSLPELWVDGKKISSFNAEMADTPLAAAEVFKYPSFDGLEIEGALYRAVKAATGKPSPLVVLVHGGPTGVWRDRYDALTQLLVARGYSVFQPNIRGSIGYGHKFVEANRADWGGKDFQDIMTGVDHLIRRGDADPERLAIGGWSYGGYMAAWAVTQTNRFKASINGAGLTDLAMEYGTENSPIYDEWFFGTPYDNPEVYRKSSPMTYIKQARTPTLILHGENDPVDPLSQAQIFHRALKRFEVPVEFVIYPREPHGLREEKHILDRYRRSVAWIEKYLGKN